MRSVEVKTHLTTTWVHAIEGVVSHYHTSVYSGSSTSVSAGGGFMHNGSGYIAPVQTHTSVYSGESTSFTVTDGQGNYRTFSLAHKEFPAQNGHRVKIVWGDDRFGANTRVLHAHNLTTGRQWAISKDQAWDWATANSFVGYPAFYRLLDSYGPGVLFGYMLLVFLPIVDMMMKGSPMQPSLFSWDGLSYYLYQHVSRLHLWSPRLVLDFFATGIGELIFGFFLLIPVLLLCYLVVCTALYLGVGVWLRGPLLYPLIRAAKKLRSEPAS